MQRVDAGYIYELGDAVRCLRQFRHQQEVEALRLWSPLVRSQQKLAEFIDQSVYVPNLRAVRPPADAFLQAAAAVVQRIVNEKLVKLNVVDLGPLFDAYDRFEPVLASELSTVTTYLVQPKGAYDVAILVEAGHSMFPLSLSTKAPEAVFDITQGCRALAFELWTAAGFHFHRANEAVLQRYFDLAAGKTNRPKIVTMGSLLSNLKQLKKGDPDIIAALDNIKNFHRNPNAHPGQSLKDADETISLVAAIRASIGYMLAKLPLLDEFELLNLGMAESVEAAKLD